jgi:Zn finger protein HypA/HybF involved in hydrogenase expression
MHEYAFIQEVINAILAQLGPEAAPGEVAQVILKVGVFEVHSEAAARQAFEVQAKGTSLEGAVLTLTVIPPMCECRSCGFSAPFAIEHHHHHDPLPVTECPQCGALAALTGGRGVESIELVLADVPAAP